MYAAKSIVLLIAAAGSLVSASDYWAMFCDDTACSQNCGESVKVSDPGCLNEGGRGSILFHGSDVGTGDYSMVVSDGSDCPCQSDCETIPTDTLCWDITLYENAESFRFISGSCDADNC